MKKCISFMICLLFVCMMSGCAWISETTQELRGELIGQNFTVSSYDNQANLISELTGDSITLATYNEKSFIDSLTSSDMDANTSGVIEVLIDGDQMLSVGNSMIFAQEGLDMVTNFNDDETIRNDTSNGLNVIPIDRLVNSYRNKFGKSRVIVICSQLGIPIGIYQGDKVRVTIPSDLPKTTRITIDGKSLYIHRANYQIFDTDLL